MISLSDTLTDMVERSRALTLRRSDGFISETHALLDSCVDVYNRAVRGANAIEAEVSVIGARYFAASQNCIGELATYQVFFPYCERTLRFAIDQAEPIYNHFLGRKPKSVIESCVFSLTHEVQHIKQLREGRLELLGMYTALWQGNVRDYAEAYRTPGGELYMRLPWEAEANEAAAYLVLTNEASIEEMEYEYGRRQERTDYPRREAAERHAVGAGYGCA